MRRLTFDDNVEECVKKLCDGNPGAICVMMEALQMDPIRGGLFLANLDDKEIYGSDIWVLYKDKNGEDIEKTVASLESGHEGELAKMISELGRA